MGSVIACIQQHNKPNCNMHMWSKAIKGQLMLTYILDKRLSSEDKSCKDRKTFQKAQRMTEQVFAPIKILWVQNTVTYNVGTFFKMSLF